MKILYSPQVNSEPLSYRFGKDSITVYHNGMYDIFDFSDMPDGQIENPKEDIETELDINPFIYAKKTNGELWVVLINHISDDADYDERFPKWVSIGDAGDING